MTRRLARMVLALALLACLAAAVTSAQQAPTTTTATETKKFEVIAVQGNHLVVRLPEGTREMTVPDDFRFTIEGQQVSVHDLKPGMSGTATITTKTTLTPVTVTEVKNGEVLQAAGSSVLVKTEEGFRNFTQAQLDERGVRIFKDGKPVQVSELHSGDRLTATIVTTKPPHVLTEKQVQATLAGGGGAGATATSGTAAPTSGATAGEPSPAPRKLPKTASPLPMAGLVGLGALLTGIGLTLRRRRQAR